MLFDTSKCRTAINKR